jgi:hypothetical protein
LGTHCEFVTVVVKCVTVCARVGGGRINLGRWA